LVVGVDEEIDTKKSIPAFGFCLRRFSKEKIPGVEEQDLPPLLFHLGDQSGFLGDTAKRVSESAARLDLAHHIICIENAELGLWRRERKRRNGQIENQTDNCKNKNPCEFE
jgi:hypothetical protein